jgi:hypothetical protein
MENMNNLPTAASLEVGRVIIRYTKETGFTYTTPENWGGKKFTNWKKKHKKDIDVAENLLLEDVNKR